MAASPKLSSELLPLENGDRMTRAEFHRRYSQHPEIRKAELVEGVVHVPSPVSTDRAEPHAVMQRWLGAFLGSRQDLVIYDNVTLKLDMDNEFQPDICLMYRDGGAARVGPDRYVYGSPELVVEISVTSTSYDLHAKKDAYRRNGVREYIVWRVFDKAIDWFALRDDEYQMLDPDAEGVVHSDVFPGLRLAVQKMLEGDIAAVLAVQTS